MAIPQDWMPSSMVDADRNALAEQYPDDPHRAAAVAWEQHAATLDATAADTATSVATGSQSVTYARGASVFAAAMSRATWHRARAKARDVQVGGTYEYGYDPTRSGSEQQEVGL